MNSTCSCVGVPPALQPHTHMLKPKVDPGNEEYVLEQLSQAEQKLVTLAEELASRDLDTICKEMEDEEVCSSSAGLSLSLSQLILYLLLHGPAVPAHRGGRGGGQSED